MPVPKKETRSSMLIGNTPQPSTHTVVVTTALQYSPLLMQALKFKAFFEQLNSFGLPGVVMSTGGEYYFNENADRQSNVESSHHRSDYILEEDDIKSVVCDLENQRVVRADAERTRGSEALDKDLIE